MIFRAEDGGDLPPNLEGEALDFTLRVFGRARSISEPYMWQHSVRVGAMGRSRIEVVLGFLHDVLEDTTTTSKELEQRFGPHIATAVQLLTRPEIMPYSEYIERMIGQKDIAYHGLSVLCVKLNDIADNVRRLPEYHTASGKRKGQLLERWCDAQIAINNALLHSNS